MPGAGKREQTGGALSLIAPPPLAHGGCAGDEEPRGGLEATLFDALHQPQAMVVGVLHLTHQIEITSGSSHDAAILPAARSPALPPAGWPSPTASSRSDTSISPGGNDVPFQFHNYAGLDCGGGRTYRLYCGLLLCKGRPAFRAYRC
jgi:hypothetical protein